MIEVVADSKSKIQVTAHHEAMVAAGKIADKIRYLNVMENISPDIWRHYLKNGLERYEMIDDEYLAIVSVRVEKKEKNC